MNELVEATDESAIRFAWRGFCEGELTCWRERRWGLAAVNAALFGMFVMLWLAVSLLRVPWLLWDTCTANGTK